MKNALYYFCIIFLSLFFFENIHAQVKKPDHASFSTDGRKVVVYTTAKNSEYRLSKIQEAGFKPKAQPFENERIIFVDPDKTFQTFLGIGGALTDASAETFAKLPAKPRATSTRFFWTSRIFILVACKSPVISAPTDYSLPIATSYYIGLAA